ncbi:MAG: ParB/RepB/Spo0J family partition protein [Deltaproteobacteria bacterium]|jgi:ParB family chromosome partitioning protein|nr:ParB/RepB/Spo0J family partition protein [Deltaproteobacteria bacterium]
MEEKAKHIKKNVLGRGLGALLTDFNLKENMPGIDDKFSVFEIEIDKVNTGVYQPRQYFDKDKLVELKNSIKENGIIQPLIVAKSKKEGEYDLIAGERRYRAAVELKFQKVPAIIKDISGAAALEIALIENIQRQDLNVIEEANCYMRLIEEYKLTHEELAVKVGKDRATITNMLRLLSLPDEVKKELIYGKITPSHARNLVGLSDDEAGMLLNTISGEKLNVRETERKVRELKTKNKENKPKKDISVSYQIKSYEEELLEKLQTKVKINYKSKGSELKGRIEIEFYSGEELERIIEFINKN